MNLSERCLSACASLIRKLADIFHAECKDKNCDCPCHINPRLYPNSKPAIEKMLQEAKL